MDELTPKQLQELKADLWALRANLRVALSAARESAQPVDLDQPIGRLSRMDAISNQQIAKASQKNHQRQLNLVNLALRTLETENYGLCLRCDMPIGYHRLKARPEARHCIECARELEAG